MRRTKKLKVGRKKIQRKSKKHCKINPFYVYVLPGAVPNLNLLLGTSLPISSNLGSVKWGKEKCVSASTAIPGTSRPESRYRGQRTCLTVFSLKWSI